MPDTWWIGDKEYPSHDAAIAAARNGDIIRCEGNHPCSSCFVTDFQSMVSMMTTGHLPRPKEETMVIPNECVVGCAYRDCTSDEHSDFCPCAKEVALFEIHDPLPPGSCWGVDYAEKGCVLWTYTASGAASNLPSASISKNDLKYERDKFAENVNGLCPRCYAAWVRAGVPRMVEKVE